MLNEFCYHEGWVISAGQDELLDQGLRLVSGLLRCAVVMSALSLPGNDDWSLRVTVPWS
jgi:hypothetical protein